MGMYFFGTWYAWWQVLIVTLLFTPLIFAILLSINETSKEIDELLKLFRR